jgi:hypothetical protein
MELTESHAKKSDMPDATCRLFQALKEQGLTVQHLRMDNSGKNKDLAVQLKSKEWQNPVKIEFTARDIPQQNSLVETAFAVNTRQASAVFGAAKKIPEVMRYCLMAQAMEYITDMKNLQPIELNGIVKSRIEHFMGAKPNWATNLHEFSEAGTVKQGPNNSRSRLTVGLVASLWAIQKTSSRHVLMYNERTRMMCTTRDVIWLN